MRHSSIQCIAQRIQVADQQEKTPPPTITTILWIERKKKKQKKARNVSFFSADFAYRLVIRVFAFVHFDFHACQTHMKRLLLLLLRQNPNTRTHKHTRTQIYGMFERSLSVASMSLTRIHKNEAKGIFKSGYSSRHVKFQEALFLMMHTYHLTVNVLRWIVEIRFEFVTQVVQNIKYVFRSWL